MKKITDFIVKGRYFFLVLFIILSGICLFLSTKVTINEDIMKYLPKSSETKIGKDLMDDEFRKQDTSILNVMFKNLSNSDKQKILEKLKDIKGVSSVSYENTAEYNKKNYTLYILNVDDYDSSKTATNVYNYVNNNFKTAGMSGSIYDENKPILQLWIVIIAVIFAMIILIILSDSYLEPFLYLISIGIAIFINKGTNIMFDSVSSITNSIVAILQLALSMDYSIMLSNRYKQEKEANSNKVAAMKEALYQSFKSISSSSVTTIVGLIALVFMSFTIGKDLGFVLAKGVLLSLASIFFCLPALLLIFDNLIAKTKKKSPNFNLTKLGNIIYKTRYFQTVLIIILFIAAYLLKGNINILYTSSQQDKVGAIFPATNQIAIVYNNKYEKLMKSYCQDFEKDKKIDQVLCYSNTINEKLAYDKLNQKFKDLGQNVEIEDYLIKIIYYNYYNKNKSNKMTLDEFISFIKSDIMTNNNFSNSLSNDIQTNLDLLKNFTSSDLINQKRSIKDIASILGMNEIDATDILIYYNSKNSNLSMTIKDFVHFMLTDVANNKKYASSLDKETISKLKQLDNFSNINIINQKMNSNELSELFGIEKNLVDKLFLFYETTQESSTKLTLNEFTKFALAMSNKSDYKDMFDETTLKSLTILNTLSNKDYINKDLDKNTMKNVLNNFGLALNDDYLTLIYLYYTGYYSSTKLTLSDFANLTLNMANNPSLVKYVSLDSETINTLTLIKNLNEKYNTPLSKEQLYLIFGISSEFQEQLNQEITESMTPKEFIDKLLSSKILANNDQTITSLKLAQYYLNTMDKKYDINELATVVAKDKATNKATISFIYGFYDNQNGNIKKISLKNLINFLYSNKSNQLIAQTLENYQNMFTLTYNVVNNVDTVYSYFELANIINKDSNQINKIFNVYDFYHTTITLTPFELVNLILNNIDNSLLQNQLSSDNINELNLVKEVMNSTINETKYSPQSLSMLLGINKNTLELLFSLYNSKYIGKNKEISLFNYVNFIVKEVMNSKEYGSNFDSYQKEKLTTINTIMNTSLNKTKHTSAESFALLSILSENLDKSLVDLVYMYYGSRNWYNESWQMTIEEFVNYLNSNIISDKRFDNFISNNKRKIITNSKKTINKSKKLIVSDKYSRIVLNTKYDFETEDTYKFINSIHNKIKNKDDIYVVGNSPMAVEMSKTFDQELNKITILTMIFIFIVVAITFKDLIIPLVLVLIIQTAVYITMSAISVTGGSVYFIALLIVQAILMGATIDYAIVYTSYYRESRLTLNIKDSIINAYNRSIHTIISSSSILIIVTLVVANFASAIAAKICETISQGTFASVILILFILPGVLATTDKLICRKQYLKNQKNKNNQI